MMRLPIITTTRTQFTRTTTSHRTSTSRSYLRNGTYRPKLNTYKTLLSLLEPFRKPKENIQPNLVWKDSPLAPELIKTRTLAIRVAGRVGERFGDVQVPATAEEEEDEDVDMGGLDVGRAKVDKVLAGL
jgi:hypothetical protein